MTGPTLPRVAIPTVTTDAARHLTPYLDAVRALTYPRWELWLVDNASADGSPAIVEGRVPGARVLRNERNLGFTGACNRALGELLRSPDAPPYVLFLNDDTEVAPDLLGHLAARADERTLVAPRTYLAGRPGILDDSAGEFDWWRGTWRSRTLGRAETPDDRVARPVGNANLSCLLVPTAAFRAAGLLDDAFFVYYDDTDFCRRVWQAGFRIWLEPGAVVYHRKGATLGGQLTAFGCYYLSRNRPYLVRKHEGRLHFTLFFAYYLATRLARSALWAARGRPDLVRATWQGLWDFVRGRMGPGREGLRTER